MKMKTSDFMNKVTVDGLNAKLRENHGISVDVAKYSKAQLEQYSKKIEAKLHKFETSNNFNESLVNENYHKNKLIHKLVETAINQYLDDPLEDDLDIEIEDVDVNDPAVAKDFAEDEKEEPEADGEEGDEEDGEEKPKEKETMSSMAMAALRSMMDNPEKMALARRAINKIKDHESVATITPQEVDAIRGPLEKFFLPILDKGMSGVSRTKPVMKTLGAGAYESVQEGKYESMPSKAHVKKMCKDGMTKAEMCKMHPNCDQPKLKAMIDDCKKEMKTMKESEIKVNKKVIKEGEEDKAALVMASKDMVDKFTSFLEDVAEMSAEGMLELQDQIRDEMGQEQAEQFTNTIGPALETTIETLKSARETLTKGVGIITGETAPDDTIGAEPDMPADDAVATDPIDPEGDDMAPMDDEFGASDAAVGGADPEGREKRESYTPKKKSIAESTRIFSTLSK